MNPQGAPSAPTHFDSARGWVVAIGCAVAIMSGFGSIYTFSVFAPTMAMEFDTGRGPVQVVFGITTFLFFGSALISGRLYDRFGIRPLLLIGGTLFCLGLVGTSYVDELWHGYVIYGIGLGFGGGLFNAPLFALAAGWFQRFRAVAQGIVATGSGLGTLIYPPLARWLLEQTDWRESFRTLAIVNVAVYALAVLLVRRAPSMNLGDPSRHIRLVIRSMPFWQMSIASVLFSTALIGALGNVISFVQQEGINSRAATVLFSAIGLASIGGRLLLTGLANRLGSVLLAKVAFFGLPVGFGLWLYSETQGTIRERYVVLLLFALVLGVSYGGFVSLMGDVTAHLFGLLGIGTVMGLLFFAAGSGSLLGPPLMGFIADSYSPQTAVLTMLVYSVAGALVLLPMERTPARLPTWVGPGGVGPPGMAPPSAVPPAAAPSLGEETAAAPAAAAEPHGVFAPSAAPEPVPVGAAQHVAPVPAAAPAPALAALSPAAPSPDVPSAEPTGAPSRPAPPAPPLATPVASSSSSSALAEPPFVGAPKRRPRELAPLEPWESFAGTSDTEVPAAASDAPGTAPLAGTLRSYAAAGAIGNGSAPPGAGHQTQSGRLWAEGADDLFSAARREAPARVFQVVRVAAS